MATKITKIQVRRDVALNWESVDPILSVGEIGLETDTDDVGGAFKIGDGVRAWKQLDYFGSGSVGNFDQVTKNGPYQGSLQFPATAPNIPPIDEVDPLQFAAAKFGTYQRGLGVYHHIFPVPGYPDFVNGVTNIIDPTIGRPDSRFAELYVKSDSIHIGDTTEDEIVISHLPGATKIAYLKIVAVNDTGGVTAAEWVIKSGEAQTGEGYRTEVGLSTKYDETDILLGVGHGFRIDITSVDDVGRVTGYNIHDSGAGYQIGERIYLKLRSQLAIKRNLTAGDGSDSYITELVTREALQEVTSQSLRLLGAGSPVAPYLQNVPASLPEAEGIETQNKFNEWTVESLRYLDNKKAQLQNCTNQLEGEGPHMFPGGIPEYAVLINTTAGRINPGFVGIDRDKVLNGGEILFFNDLEEWEISAGSGGGGIDDEKDPVFTASDAFRIVEATEAKGRFLNYTTDSVLSGNRKIERIMYQDNWDGIDPLI